MVAGLRFCAGLHTRAGSRVISNLCAFALAERWAIDANPRAACGAFFLWLDLSQLSGSGPAEPQPDRPRVFSAGRHLPVGVCGRSQCHSLLPGFTELPARGMA